MSGARLETVGDDGHLSWWRASAGTSRIGGDGDDDPRGAAAAPNREAARRTVDIPARRGSPRCGTTRSAAPRVAPAHRPQRHRVGLVQHDRRRPRRARATRPARASATRRQRWPSWPPAHRHPVHDLVHGAAALVQHEGAALTAARSPCTAPRARSRCRRDRAGSTSRDANLQAAVSMTAAASRPHRRRPGSTAAYTAVIARRARLA